MLVKKSGLSYDMINCKKCKKVCAIRKNTVNYTDVSIVFFFNCNVSSFMKKVLKKNRFNTLENITGVVDGGNKKRQN